MEFQLYDRSRQRSRYFLAAWDEHGRQQIQSSAHVAVSAGFGSGIPRAELSSSWWRREELSNRPHLARVQRERSTRNTCSSCPQRPPSHTSLLPPLSRHHRHQGRWKRVRVCRMTHKSECLLHLGHLGCKCLRPAHPYTCAFIRRIRVRLCGGDDVCRSGLACRHGALQRSPRSYRGYSVDLIVDSSTSTAEARLVLI